MRKIQPPFRQVIALVNTSGKFNNCPVDILKGVFRKSPDMAIQKCFLAASKKRATILETTPEIAEHLVTQAEAMRMEKAQNHSDYNDFYFIRRQVPANTHSQ